jgi:demethoxyubiquinone hydroxylase (CLK1/Coq7/Cat5 family)
MQQAAIEEQDHLAWCEDRLKELNSHTISPLMLAHGKVLEHILHHCG